MSLRVGLKLNKDADIAVSMKKRLRQFQNYRNIIVPEAAGAVLPHLAAVQAVLTVPAVLGAVLQGAEEQAEAGKLITSINNGSLKAFIVKNNYYISILG
jgi:hypothetical protein